MIFLENSWIWLALAATIFIVAWVMFQQSGKLKPLAIGATVAALVLALGFVLVFCVETDRQKVVRTINALADAIAENDVEKVCSHLEPEAAQLKSEAKRHMGLANIEWTKVRDLKIGKINYYTSPASVSAAFRGTVGGRVRQYDAPFTVVVQFTDVLLREGDDGKWYVTDQCVFSYPGFEGRGKSGDSF